MLAYFKEIFFFSSINVNYLFQISLFMLFRSVKRYGQSPEKINRGMILAPLVGIIVNLLEASTEVESIEQNDMIEVLARMDCPDTVLFGLQYMLEFNWVSS